jgi:hypothetical protein
LEIRYSHGPKFIYFRFPIYPPDMSIFSYGYIGMDISEMMTSEVSEISEIWYIQISDKSRLVCLFLALDISEMDLSEMTSSNVSEISEFPIYSFQISRFSDKPPFLPAPDLQRFFDTKTLPQNKFDVVGVLARFVQAFRWVILLKTNTFKK